MRLIFMGTPDFSVPSLNALYEAGHEICLVVTKPDTAKDRGKKIQSCPVKQRAEELGLSVSTPEKIRDNKEFLSLLESLKPDVIIAVAYGKILPKRVLDIPKYGCMNVHASLLPKYRGAAPVHRAVINGDEKTGVTIMYMGEGMDTGDICLQEETPVGRKTTEELWDELSAMGAGLLVKALSMTEDGRAPRIVQPEEGVSMAPMVFKEEGIIDFSKSAREVDCLIRGFYSWPMASTVFRGQVMKIHAAHPSDDPSVSSVERTCAHNQDNTDNCAEPGTVLSADKNGITVACGRGSIVITRVQMPGKKAMDVSAFILGNKVEAGTVLG